MPCQYPPIACLNRYFQKPHPPSVSLRHLLEQGYDDIQLAEEVAGTIIAIQEAKDLSEEEKASYLRKLGFNDIKEVEIAVSESLETAQQPLEVEYRAIKNEKVVKQLESIRIDEFIYGLCRKNWVQAVGYPPYYPSEFVPQLFPFS